MSEIQGRTVPLLVDHQNAAHHHIESRIDSPSPIATAEPSASAWQTPSASSSCTGRHREPSTYLCRYHDHVIHTKRPKHA